MYCTARILKMGRRRIYGVAECHGKAGNLFSHHTITYVRRLKKSARRCGASPPSSSRRTPRAGTAKDLSQAGPAGPRRDGALRVAIAEEWGGAGLDYTPLAVACEEIAAEDCSTATIVMVNNLVAGILAGYGNRQQKERFLKPLAQGKLLGAFALTEPQVGSDASAITTRAEKQGSHYLLNGVKQFITSGQNADVAVIFAVTQKQAAKRGISAFLVPTSAPGYKVARIEEKTGQRASDTAQIVLENCKAEELLGEEGAGYRIALANLESGRINVAAQATGVARAALEAAIAYARERKSMGKALIEHQAVNALPTWRPRWKRRASSTCTPRACAMQESPASRKRPWRSSSPPKWRRNCSDAIQIHGDLRLCLRLPGRAAVARCARDEDLRRRQRHPAPRDRQSPGGRMKAPIDFYFDFSSPCGYASHKIEPLAANTAAA